MTALPVILGTMAVLVLLPVTVLSVQVIAARMGRQPGPNPDGVRPRIAVLIPAHNESAVIAETLRSILPQLVAGDRALVVADNCTDETAAIARGHGAEVTERNDPERRGKEYALDHGVRRLRDDPPGVVIIIDADCRARPGTIERLARVCHETSRPVQALYQMHSPDGAVRKIRIAEFAWIVRNHVRPLGNLRFGLPCQLMGTGMAFPWDVIRNADLVSGQLAEDMKLGIELALSGYPAVFCPDAVVTSFFPRDRTARNTQSTRWEHGHLTLILREFPRLIARAIRKGDAGLLVLAADLMVPPLTLLAFVLAIVLLSGYLLFRIESVVWPFHVSLVALWLFIIAITVAWHGWGRGSVSFLSLLAIPFYMLSKIPLYLRFLVKRQKTWIKTGRD